MQIPLNQRRGRGYSLRRAAQVHVAAPPDTFGLNGLTPASDAFLDQRAAFKTILTTTLLAVGTCALIATYSAQSQPSAQDRYFIALCLLMPSVFFAMSRSTRQLDHLLLLIVINRELRRLLDWGEGRYDPWPVLSLLPLLAAFCMLFTVTSNWRRLPKPFRKAAVMFGVALAYAMAIGYPRYGMSSIYACAEYLTPLLIMYFCVACRPTAAVLQRWTLVLVTLGVLVAVYGVVQWIVVPPWDAAWLIWSGMVTSMGEAQPFQMSICSTLESRGPAAMFLAVITALLIGIPTYWRRGGIFLGAVTASAMLMTRARTGLVYLVLSVCATAAVARGRAGAKMILAMCVTAGVTVVLLRHQEGSDQVLERVATLSEVQSDNSAVGRIDIAREGFAAVLANPLGMGLGSGGNAAKVSNSGQNIVGDNGYLEILATLGIPGTAFYAAGLFAVIRLAFQNRSLVIARDANADVGLGMLVALAPALAIGNCLITAHAAYVWILLARHISTAPPKVTARRLK